MTALKPTCHACGAALDPGRAGGRCACCLFAECFAPPPEEGAIGTIGGHVLLEEIARGGMGVVYRARQREPEREVALKTLRGAALDSIEAVVRFRHEAAAMAGLEHAAILPVFNFGEHDGVPFFTMKLATGGTLAQRLGDYAGKWRAIAELVAHVAAAVQHAHARAVLHRDLKPGNILFDANGHAFVADFGLAKLLDSTDGALTRTAAVLGTPHYLAPEIAAHDARAATIASDVWSLGVILYELLGQQLPFTGDSIAGVLRAITDTAPGPLPGAPPRDLAVIAMKALAREPARRYATAGALAEDLRRWLGGRAIVARKVSTLGVVRLWARRNPALALATAIAIGTAGVAGALLWKSNRTLRHTLARSLVEQAALARTQAVAGTRAEVLRLLRDAAALEPRPTAEQRAEWRTEAVAALALPDVRVTRRLAAFSQHNAGQECFSADLARFAAAQPGGFAVFDTASGRAVREFRPPAGQEEEWRHFFAGTFRLSPDGAMLAASFQFPARHESLTRVFDVASGTRRGEIRGFENQPPWPMWWARAEDGFLAAPRGEVPTWHDARGEPAAAFPAAKSLFEGSEFFPHEKTHALAVRTTQPTGVAVWEGAATPVQRWHLPLLAVPHGVAWSADGRWLALGEGNPRTAPDEVAQARETSEILLVDAATGKISAHLPGHPVPIVAVAFAGESVLSLGMDEQIVWQSAGEFRLTLPAQPRLLQVSPDGARMAFAPVKGALAIADLVAPIGGRRWTGSGHHKMGSCLGASADGRILVLSNETGLQLWDGASGTLREELPWPAGFTSAWAWFEVEPGGGSVVVQPGPSATEFHPLWQFPIAADGHFTTPRALADTAPIDGIHGFSPGGGDWVVSGRAAAAQTRDALDIALWPGGDPARGHVALRNVVAAGMHVCTPDAHFGITADQHHPDAHVWDLQSGKEVRALGYGVAVTCLVSPDRRTVAVVSPDESSLWDSATWTKRAAWKTPPGGDGFTPQFSADGRLLAQLDRHGRAVLHLAESGAPWLSLTLPAGFSARECEWLGGARLVVMGRTGELYEWNLAQLGAAVAAEGLPW